MRGFLRGATRETPFRCRESPSRWCQTPRVRCPFYPARLGRERARDRVVHGRSKRSDRFDAVSAGERAVRQERDREPAIEVEPKRAPGEAEVTERAARTASEQRADAR